MLYQQREVKFAMCLPVQNQSCNCSATCGWMTALTIEDEIKLLEATKQRMQVQ